MEEKGTLNILKIATMLAICMAAALAVVLWIKNDSSPYFVMDSTLVGDKCMLALEAVILLVIVYKSVFHGKYFITFLAFMVAALTFWVKLTGNEILDVEYIKIDRFAIMMCIAVAVSYVIITINTFAISDVSGDGYIWMFVSAVGLMGAILGYDVMWTSFFVCVTYFGIYMRANEEGNDLFGNIFLGMGLLAQIIMALACVFAKNDLEYTSLQSVIVCKAMGIEGSLIPTVLILTSACVIIFSGFVMLCTEHEDENMGAYCAAVVPGIFGTYIFTRFIPAFMGYTLGDIVKYAGICVCIIIAVILNIVKKSEKCAVLASELCIASMLSLAGTGVPITAWHLIMYTLIYVPLFLLIFLGGNKSIYCCMVTAACIILAPIQMICYRASAFKLYIESEDKVYLILLVAAYVIMVIAVMRRLYKYLRTGTNANQVNKNAVCVSLITLAAVLALMPLTIKYWIYPAMSQTDLMVANISESHIPISHVVVAGVMAVIVFAAPAAARMISRKIKISRKIS